MLWLASLPTATPRTVPRRVELDPTDHIRSALLGIAASIVIGPLMVAAVTLLMRSYGLTLFLATPFVLGGVTAYIHNHNHPRTSGETFFVVMIGLFIVGATLLLFALEGVICVLMAAPIAVIAATLGGIVGKYAAINTGSTPHSAAYFVIVLPIGLVADRIAPAPPVYEAVTSIVVNAPPERVWEMSFASTTSHRAHRCCFVSASRIPFALALLDRASAQSDIANSRPALLLSRSRDGRRHIGYPLALHHSLLPFAS